MTSMPPRLVKTRVSASRRRRFSAATRTRTCCPVVDFAEDLASFSGPRRLWVGLLERSFTALSVIGVPFSYVSNAFALSILTPSGSEAPRKRAGDGYCNSSREKGAGSFETTSEPAPRQLRHEKRTEQAF